MDIIKNIPVSMIVCDLDGTLLSSDGVIPEGYIAALKKAQRLGIRLAIASGRLANVCSRIAKEHGLEDIAIIGMNGAHILRSPFGETLRLCAYDRPLAVDVLGIIKACGCMYNVYTEHGVYSNRQLDGEGMQAFSRHFRDSFVDIVVSSDAGQRALEHKVLKFLVRPDFGFEGYNRAKRMICQLPGLYLTSSSESNFEVMQAGLGKDEAVKALAKSENIPMERVMAFGDYDNDIPMLMASGYPVAMGNASGEAVNAARYRTKSNKDGGVGFAIELMLDGKLEEIRINRA